MVKSKSKEHPQEEPTPPDKPLVANPIAHVIFGAIHNPRSLGPMLRDALEETAEVLLDEAVAAMRHRRNNGKE
jgi:hypothetical protein